MKITEEIEFIEDLPLFEQSLEFQKWYMTNVSSKINDKLIPDSLDEFDRPVSFTIEQDGFLITVFWFYIYESKSNWACKRHDIKIKKKE